MMQKSSIYVTPNANRLQIFDTKSQGGRCGHNCHPKFTSLRETKTLNGRVTIIPTRIPMSDLKYGQSY